MPPRPPLANTVKIEINMNGPDAAQAHNIGYVSTTADTTSPTVLNAVGAAVGAGFTTSGYLAPIWSTEWTLTSVTASDYSGLSEAFANNVYSFTGSLAGNGNSPQVAVVIGWSIAARYRGGHPRWYLPGVMPNVLATPGGRHLDTSHQSAFQSWGAQMLSVVNATTVTGHSLQLGTVSFYSGHSLRPTPLFRPFIACQVPTRIGTQRRRLGKETPTH